MKYIKQYLTEKLKIQKYEDAFKSLTFNDVYEMIRKTIKNNNKHNTD